VPKHPDPKPPLEIIIGSGGRLIVASDVLLSQVDSLARLSDQLRLSAGELLGILERTDATPSLANDVPVAVADARRVMSEALHQLLLAQARASAIRRGVLIAINRYARTEQTLKQELHLAGEQSAWWLGTVLRAVALPLLLPAGIAALETLGGLALFGVSPAELGGSIQTLLRAHGRLLTNDVTVSVVREMAADADGFLAGATGIPLPVAAALESSGITGVPSAAGEVVGFANLAGLFVESPVTVRKTSAFEYGKPPTSILDRANSFPDSDADPNGEQIRIDRYIQPGRPDRFDVFISGTATFNPKATTQPFDFTSDLTGVAKESPGSVRAVEQAMVAAGVTPSSPVVVNGYSQGGLVASMVAASGRFNVKGVVTFGAPSAQISIPASIPVLSVRNTEDLVPATSGYDVNPNAVIVERSAFPDGPVSTEWAVPAHALDYYQQTAVAVDQAHSSEVRSVVDPLNSFGAGAQRVDSTLWVAKRTHG
jgi:hypothetical protein